MQSMSRPHTSDESGITIAYDGECPFCSAYVRMVRLRESVGPVTLIDARMSPDVVAEMNAAELDLDDGMVVKMGGRLYHGDECVHLLALLSTQSGLFNRANAWIFRSKRISRILYPVLRAGRNLVLRLLGRKKIAKC